METNKIIEVTKTKIEELQHDQRYYLLAPDKDLEEHLTFWNDYYQSVLSFAKAHSQTQTAARLPDIEDANESEMVYAHCVDCGKWHLAQYEEVTAEREDPNHLFDIWTRLPDTEINIIV